MARRCSSPARPHRRRDRGQRQRRRSARIRAALRHDRSADQVQIYESILGDSDSRPTTGLLSAVKYLKDNRLLPRGFDKATADPQIAVFGDAATDASFIGGGDRVRYRIRVPAGRRLGAIDVELRYQPIALSLGAQSRRVYVLDGAIELCQLLPRHGITHIDHCGDGLAP